MARRQYRDPAAQRLWRRCSTDSNLRWLLEGVLSQRNPALGRILLLSPVEFFGQVQAPIGRKLSLLFELTGLPFLSGSVKQLSRSLARMAAAQSSPHRSEARSALQQWAEANGKEARDRIAAAALETVRRNPALKKLVGCDQPITNLQVAKEIPSLESLDWTALKDLVEIFDPFLARPKSKKHINRLTLDFTSLLRHGQPELSQLEIALRSASHFANLLKRRAVTETAWRELVLALISRGFLSPHTPMFLWCKSCPAAGFVASLPFSFCPLPPVCPGCADPANAIASYRPADGLGEAVNLKDGLLGAAIGWHLIKRRATFSHSKIVGGEETDFLVLDRRGTILIECKMLTVDVADKNLMRKLRDAADQLVRHSKLLQESGSELVASVCVTNLTSRQLKHLRVKALSPGVELMGVLSYEEFCMWFRSRHRR